MKKNKNNRRLAALKKLEDFIKKGVVSQEFNERISLLPEKQNKKERELYWSRKKKDLETLKKSVLNY